MPEFVSLEESVSHVQDYGELIVGGFSTYGCAEELRVGCARYAGRASKTSPDRGITPGDKTESTEYQGVNKLAAEGDRHRIWSLNDAGPRKGCRQ